MKKMRRRFIVAAMTAFGTVMLVLVTVINIVNYCQTTRRQDELAENLLSHERSAYAEPQKPPPPFRIYAAEGRKPNLPPVSL